MNMLKRTKQVVCLLLCTAIMLSMLPKQVFAEETAAQGTVEYGVKNPTYANHVATFDCVWFGKYTQLNSENKGPIKWRVLSVDGNKALLMADKNLENKRFNDEWNWNVPWENCTLREWMNSDFKETAFTENEQAALINHSETGDSVFALSKPEMDAFNAQLTENGFDSMAIDAVWKSSNTNYLNDCLQKAEIAEPNSGWWLRSNWLFNFMAYFINWGGGQDYRNVDEKDENGRTMARPCVYLDLSKTDCWSYAGTISSDGSGDDKDSDGDGLPDSWEINGVDTNGDGVVDLHLEQMGADPNVPDIFVEIDWMYQEGKVLNLGALGNLKIEEEKNLQPSETAMKMVYDQFKNHGINLHLDVGPDSIDYVTGKPWGELSGGNSMEYVKKVRFLDDEYKIWKEYYNKNFSKSRECAFHHVMFINRFFEPNQPEGFQWSVSGNTAGIPGQASLVADCDGGCSENDTEVAGTFMHELGHQLGLQHGGVDSVQYKVNNLSIMNYLYQFSGLVGTNEINYSEYELPAIDENRIDESIGIDPDGVTNSKLGTKWFFKGEEREAHNITKKSIDYNLNGKTDKPYFYDLNNDNELTKYTASINEWEHINYSGSFIGDLGASVDKIFNAESEISEELSYTEAVEKGLLGNAGACGIDNIEPSKVYSNDDNERITISINNLGTEKTAPTIKVKSPILEKDYEQKIEIDASVGEIKSTIIEIPINSAIEDGDYTIECEVTCENGIVVNKTETISVAKAGTIDLAKNKELDSPEIDKLTESGYNWSVTGDSVQINNGRILAVHKGTALITGVKEEGDPIKFFVEVSDNSSDDKNHGKTDNTTNINGSNGSNNIKKNTDSKDISFKPVANEKPAKTGDSNLSLFYITIMFFSFITIITCVRMRMKKKN